MAFVERRLFPRNRALRRGKIAFNSASSTIDCTLSNHSDGGAKLDVASPLGIPSAFELRLPGQPLRTCELVWRKAHEVGVRFTAL